MSFNKRIKPMITDENPIAKDEDTPPIPDKKYPVEGMTTGPVWMRTEPSEDGGKIKVITSGRVVDILEIKGDWAFVEYIHDKGYIKSAYVKEV